MLIFAQLALLEAFPAQIFMKWGTQYSLASNAVILCQLKPEKRLKYSLCNLLIIWKNIVLGIFAHPDDAEVMCAGTLSLFRKAGWSVHIATIAPGDKGTAEYLREDISRIRKAEAAASKFAF